MLLWFLSFDLLFVIILVNPSESYGGYSGAQYGGPACKEKSAFLPVPRGPVSNWNHLAVQGWTRYSRGIIFFCFIWFCIFGLAFCFVCVRFYIRFLLCDFHLLSARPCRHGFNPILNRGTTHYLAQSSLTLSLARWAGFESRFYT